MKIFHRAFILSLIALVACPDIAGANKAQLPLAGCATRIAANGFVNALQAPIASALLDTPREVTVRQRAILGRDGKLHLFDVVLGNDPERPIILMVAGAERIRSVFFLTRAD